MVMMIDVSMNFEMLANTLDHHPLLWMMTIIGDAIEYSQRIASDCFRVRAQWSPRVNDACSEKVCWGRRRSTGTPTTPSSQQPPMATTLASKWLGGPALPFKEMDEVGEGRWPGWVREHQVRAVGSGSTERGGGGGESRTERMSCSTPSSSTLRITRSGGKRERRNHLKLHLW